MSIITTIQKALPKGDTVTTKKTSKSMDVVVSSKDRVTAKKVLESALKKQKIPFKSVFKRSKSSSIEVLELAGVDIIFKPIRAKGAGGLSFEKEVMLDLQNFLNGVPLKELRHPDVVKELEKEIELPPKKGWMVVHEGSKNSRRELKFDGRKVVITNSNGATLSDLTLTSDKGKKTFLSLKSSKTYYVTSSKIIDYFLSSSTQVQINEFFGFDGVRIGGFGKGYVCETKEPRYQQIRQNLGDLLSNAIGSGLVVIHKKQTGDVYVKEVKTPLPVLISDLSENSYSYPEKNVRKYANIKVLATISGQKYVVNFQFRGTTGVDTGPRYLRILMERL
jgi:hypothetical protein